MTKIKIPNRPVGPFPTALAGADVQGKPNYATVGACGVVCLEPVLYISLKSTHHTAQGVRENGCFSVNIPGSDLVEATDYCGIVSGNKVDKSGVFTVFYDEAGRAPLIRECPLNFLCKVFQTIEVRGFEMFLGEIVAAYLNEDCLSEGRPDPLKINPLILMGSGYYDLHRMLGEVFKSGAGKVKSPEK